METKIIIELARDEALALIEEASPIDSGLFPSLYELLRGIAELLGEELEVRGT